MTHSWHKVTRWGQRWAVIDGHITRPEHPISLHNSEIDAIADAARRNAGITKPRKKKT